MKDKTISNEDHPEAANRRLARAWDRQRKEGKK